jgi:protein involved in polysaccharide export with SLBB domain
VKQYLIIPFFLSWLILTFAANGARAQEHKITEDDLIHYGDVIDVDIVGGFEFDWRGTLTPEGFLDGFDANGEPIYGLCRSQSQIGLDVAKILGRILREPKVVVRIIDRSNRAVARLDGAVRTASRFRLQRVVYLSELLVLAGGFTDGASGEITIYRPRNLSCRRSIIQASALDTRLVSPQDNGSIVTNIKISELLSGKAAANPQILSGDLITVTKALPIYVIGAVNNPRPVYTRDQMTVSRIVATAGGLAKDAEGNKVSIFRRDGLDVRNIEADLGKIKRGETDDEILRPFDIIEVAAKGGGKRKYPPVVANEENRDRLKQDLPLRVVD